MQNNSIDDHFIDFEKSFLLWISTSSKELPTYQSRLCSLFDQQRQFADQSQCEEYILQYVSKDDRIVLIIDEGNICQDLLVHITKLPQVSEIYIQCSCKYSHEDSNNLSCKQFNKVS